ncbi:Ankyrin repeat domain-containing protein 13C [Actinomortierella wolfii]|nr:Ankyrin repeat domain-containing protein 13C [Actinomortierella wolfii]
MATTASIDPNDPLALHKAVFLNQPHTLRMCLAPYASAENTEVAPEAQDKESVDVRPQSRHHPYINHLDHRNQSPLHLAIMLNRKEMVELLLSSGANPMIRSGLGWTPRQEATSLGDRKLIALLTRHYHRTMSGSFRERATGLVKKLSQDLDQFYFQLQWEFQCWVPFVSHLCPNDTYHIWKKGHSVRMDTSLGTDEEKIQLQKQSLFTLGLALTPIFLVSLVDTELVGFENLKWIRGHISIIFHVDPVEGPELVLVDRVKKIVQRLARSTDEEKDKPSVPTEEEVEREVATNVPTSAISFTRAKTGLWGYRTPKTEKVGQYECSVWKMEGIEFRTRTRTEHLKDEFGQPIPPLSKKQLQQHAHRQKRNRKQKHGERHEESPQHRRKKKDSHARPSLPIPTAQPKVNHENQQHGHATPPNAMMHRSSPRHQPLFPVEPMVAKEDSASADHMATRGSSAVDPKDNEIQMQGGGVLKKHTRSVGTISDDAFFEQALQEAEGDDHAGSDGGRSEGEDAEDGDDIPYRPSLPPPPPPTVTFEEYFDTSNADPIHLGRPLEMKETRKSFGATLWMYEDTSSSSTSAKSNYLTAPKDPRGGNSWSKNSSTTSINSSVSAGTDDATPSSSTALLVNPHVPPASPHSHQQGATQQTPAQRFPLTIDRILPLLEVIGMDNNRLVGKLREFLEYKLPPGFPIRANIPLYPSLSADVTFVNFDSNREIGEDMFEIPDERQGYVEGFVIRHQGADPEEDLE